MVTVKVEKNHSGTYELSETERSKLETAMFPTEYRRSGLPGIKSWQFLYQSMQEKPPVEGSLYEGSEDDFENVR